MGALGHMASLLEHSRASVALSTNLSIAAASSLSPVPAFRVLPEAPVHLHLPLLGSWPPCQDGLRHRLAAQGAV